MLWLMAAVLPFSMTGGFINGTRGGLRVFGIIGTFVLPLILIIYFFLTAPNVPEDEDDWGWAFAMAQLTYLTILWLVSAAIGCFVGWLTLRAGSRTKKRT